jgi:uncharacterized membrane protein YraQ (UPF0718 family)
MKKEAAKFILDIAKLLIGGVLLTGIMRRDIPPQPLFIVGSIVTIIFVAVAFFLLWKDNKTDNQSN